jgi:Large polyvalent protein associated domain 29
METTAKYIPEVTMCAKDIRAELKREMPKVKFSVKSQSYSMGNSVRISWELGPTERQVKKYVDKYEAGSFDGMTDSYTYTPKQFRTQYSAKYVQCSRHIPSALFETMCHDYAKVLGATYINYNSQHQGEYIASLVNRLLSVFELPNGYQGIQHVPFFPGVGDGTLESLYEFMGGIRQPRY